MRHISVFIALMAVLLCTAMVYADGNHPDMNLNGGGMGPDNHGPENPGHTPGQNQMYTPPPQPTPVTTGTIVVSNDIYRNTGIRFILVGPSGSTEQETSPYTFTNMQPGTYKIITVGTGQENSGTLYAGSTLSFVL